MPKLSNVGLNPLPECGGSPKPMELQKDYTTKWKCSLEELLGLGILKTIVFGSLLFVAGMGYLPFEIDSTRYTLAPRNGEEPIFYFLVRKP